MKTIKVLGSGCSSCTATEELIKKVAIDENVEVKIIKVDEIQDIMAYDVMSTPAVVIDEKVIIKGRVPSKEEVINFLKSEGDNCCSDTNDACCDTATDATGSSCCS